MEIDFDVKPSKILADAFELINSEDKWIKGNAERLLITDKVKSELHFENSAFHTTLEDMLLCASCLNLALEDWKATHVGEKVDYGYCAIGAIDKVEAKKYNAKKIAQETLLLEAMYYNEQYFPSIPDWNDREETSYEEVCSVFGNAISNLERAGL